MEKQLRNISNHSVMILKTLKRYREDAIKLCDLVLQVEDQVFPVHRSVLAACSQYFYAMFAGELKESSQSTVVLNDVKANILKQLLDFAYDGEIEIHSKNVEDILRLATQLQFIQTCRSGVGVGALRGSIYALGGYDGHHCLSSVERFNPIDNKWHFIASMNFARSFPGVASLNDLIYVIGGNDGSTFLNTCECYDPHTDKWCTINPMNNGRAGVGCAVLDGCLYVAGGYDGIKRLNLVEKYDPNTDTWVCLSPMTSCRDGVSLASYGGYIFAIGGIDGPSYLNSVEYYDPLNDTWMPSQEMRTSRAACGVAVLSNKEL